MKKVFAGLVIASVGLFASQSSDLKDSFGLKVGTLGVGVEYTHQYKNNIAARVGVNSYTYDTSGVESGIDYDVDLELQTFSVIADYYPGESGFRLSGGLMLNNNELKYKGKATGGNFTINNVTYAAADIGSLDGNIDFDNVAPYLGIGYSGRSGSWAFTGELGAMYQGSPNTNLNVTCGSALSAAQCSALRADVEAERAELDKEIEDFEWYPVVSIGLSYRF